MTDLDINGTQSTPSVTSDWAQGVLEIKGDSYPENSYEIFSPILKWVDDFLAQESRPFLLRLGLLYLNTSSVKVMMDIFDEMQGAFDAGRDVRVEWLYAKENERVAELAGEFKEDYSFPFVIEVLQT